MAAGAVLTNIGTAIIPGILGALGIGEAAQEEEKKGWGVGAIVGTVLAAAALLIGIIAIAKK